MTETPTLLTADDLLTRPGYKHHELIDGVPVEKHMGALASYTAGQVAVALSNHCRHTVGRVFGGNTGYHCFPGRPALVRKPDASVVLAGRLPGGVLPDGWLTVAPDLAVRVPTYWDAADDAERRVADYRAAGVKLVWLISSQWKTALVRRLDGTAAEVGPAGTLSGEDVVPGFACPVADLFG